MYLPRSLEEMVKAKQNMKQINIINAVDVLNQSSLASSSGLDYNKAIPRPPMIPPPLNKLSLDRRNSGILTIKEVSINPFLILFSMFYW